MKKLSPIKFEKIWGYENWIASTHAHGTQQEFLDFAGGDFPLLVKIIQANKTLSVQVHPDDEKAALYENCRGKTEFWYVLSADEGAQLIYGLNGVYTASEIRRAIEAQSLHDFLHYVEIHTGDFIYLPAGTVHAICGGSRILEIQQSSDITYRLYDWGRGRKCNIERGISCIKNGGLRNVKSFSSVFSCPFFELEEITVEGEYSAEFPKVHGKKIPSDTILFFVLCGSGKINGENASKEEIFAFAPGEKLFAKGEMSLIKIIATEQKRY